MFPILLGSLAGTAHAEAVIEFKTSGPVQIFVDGRQATLTSNLRQRVAGLDPGVHELKVTGMFGKTLYEAEIELPDDTLTTASWERGQIKVLSTEWLDEVAAEEPLAAEAAAEPAPETVAVAPPEEVPVDPVPVEPPLAIPAEEPVVAAPPVVEEEVVPATTLPPMSPTRTLTIQASEGMRIEVVHEGRKVTVVVEGHTFRIEDPTGLSLALGEQ